MHKSSQKSEISDDFHYRISRPIRIVSVCIRGSKPRRLSYNERQADLLHETIDRLVEASGWDDIDAVIFPGGYFRTGHYVGHMPYRDRAATLEQTQVGRSCRMAADHLSDIGVGALLVVGMDSMNRGPADRGDQLCVAFDSKGVAGIGRKVFPTDGDTNGETCAPLVCYASDFADPHRIVTLPSGGNAILCACYDVFGVAAAQRQSTLKCGHIRYLMDPDRRTADERGFRQRRRELVSDWARFLIDRRTDVSLGAIHHFRRPGRDIFWQRHGIAAASAALGGGLSVGAAFFAEALPRLHGDGWKSTLAARDVPMRHLANGLTRRAHVHDAIDGFTFGKAADGGPKALVRLFEGPSPS